jgi:EPS-associated MarR family transcriptional regulator|tara:strand:+ start:229 stop:537 length:309 start_codon:yes stop_codon:yes gene_type:complete
MTKDYDTDKFNILRAIGNKPGKSQRELSKDLDLSLGKINYCIKALREKGLIKIGNFSKNSQKLNYIYLLTPKGISNKTRLTINFMKRKMREYEELKKELKNK